MLPLPRSSKTACATAIMHDSASQIGLNGCEPAERSIVDIHFTAKLMGPFDGTGIAADHPVEGSRSVKIATCSPFSATKV